MRRSGHRRSVSVGDSYKNMKVGEAFLEDYIRSHRRKDRPEFKGVKNISPDSSRTTVVVTCGDAKEPAKKVAKDVAKHVERCVAGDEELSTHLFPVKTKGRKVRIRIMGPEDNWTRRESTLRRHFSPEDGGGANVANTVTGITVKKTKATQRVVAVRFIKTDDPPLYDVGGGHMVACYLFRGGSA